MHECIAAAIQEALESSQSGSVNRGHLQLIPNIPLGPVLMITPMTCPNSASGEAPAHANAI
jgi:hypothetical protein